jgi:hypothetical protein
MGKSPVLEHIAGRYYGPTLGGGTFTLTAIPTNPNVIHFIPIFMPKQETFTTVGFKTGSGFTGTAVYRIGLYTNTNAVPTTLVSDFGTVSATASSSYYQVTTTQSLSAGWYWIAIGCVSSTSSPTIQALGQAATGYGFQSSFGTSDAGSLYAAPAAAVAYFTNVASLTAMPNPISTAISYSNYAILAYFLSS